MSGYLIRVWCDDCGDGQDPMGCFDGAHELRGRDGCEALDPFETIEEADAAGWEFCNGPPWEFEVVTASVPHKVAERSTP